MDEYLESLEAHVRIDVRSKHQTPAAFAQSLCDAVPEGYRGIAAIDGLEIVQHDPEIAKHLVDAIEGTKSRVTWILASRSSDGLPIGTWLTYGDCERIIGAGDLRFTLEEAEGLTRHLGCEANDDELAGVLELTEGWPAAVHVALRSGSHPGENHKLLAAVRDATQRLWTEQVFPDLRDRERELLTVGALLPEIDVGLLVLAGFPDALQMLENVRRRTSLLEEGAGGTYRCATLFREFLRQRAELSGKDGQRVPHFLAARALETAGKVEAALDAYGAAQKKAEILRMLEHHGFDLLERGRADVVSRATEALTGETRQGNPRILALRGVVQSLAGNPARAEALLRRALSRAKNDRDLAGFARLRLAPLIANYGSDVVEILDPVADDATQPTAVRAEALSLRATAHAILGKTLSAKEDMRLAEELLVDVNLDSTRARILQRVGVAAMYVREADRARKSLAQAADLANELQLHSIASRACSALSNLMCHEFDDVMSQLWYAEQAAAAAAESGDSLELQTALLQVASAEMRRGNAEESAAIEDQLVGIKSDPDRAYLLVAFKALRLAWDSRFGDAHRELSRCWNRMFHDFDRLVCGAQCALFLAIDGRRESSIQLTGEVSALADNVLVHGLFCTRYIALGMLLCVITETINERPVHADRAAKRIVSPEKDPVVAIAHDIAEEFLDTNRGPLCRGEISSALDRLSTYGYADVARLVKVASIAADEKCPTADVGNLTPAELAVLRLLGEGLSNKEIAVRHGRSINTVRAQVSSIITKLKCRGRSQATVVARRLGIIA